MTDRSTVDPPHDSELTFPDLPRLELDQLLGSWSSGPTRSWPPRGGCGGCCMPTRSSAADLALPVVLRRIVEAARELVGARYAALGVISPAGGLSEFVHIGMPADTVERDRAPPPGQGSARRPDR